MPKCFDVRHRSQQIWMICVSQGPKDSLKVDCITGTYFFKKTIRKLSSLCPAFTKHYETEIVLLSL